MYFILQQKCAYYGEDDDYLVDMIYQRKKMFLSTQAYEVKCSLEEAEKVHELRKKLEREAPIKDSQPKLKEALISIFGNHAVSDITTKTKEKMIAHNSNRIRKFKEEHLKPRHIETGLTSSMFSGITDSGPFSKKIT